MPDWASQIGGWIALVVFLGGVVIYLRGSRDKGTISTLEQNNKALAERVTLLEASELRLKAEAEAADKVHNAKIEALNIRVEALEAENVSLRAQRPSAEAIAEVAAMQQVLHEQLTEHDIATLKALQGKAP